MSGCRYNALSSKNIKSLININKLEKEIYSENKPLFDNLYANINDLEHCVINYCETIEKALEKIKLPEFGVCVRCSKSIAQGRIVLMPESTLCVCCAEKR